MVSLRSVQRLDTHARVIAAANAQFLEYGFADATIRGIAAAAGVSTGTVMLVGDKRALLVKVFDTLIEDIHRRREPGGDQTDTHSAAESPVSETILSLLTPFLDLFTSRGDLARAYASILVEGTSTSTVFTDLAAMLITEIAGVLGEDRPGTGQTGLARAVYYAYIGTLFTWPKHLDNETDALRASLRTTINAICEKGTRS